MERFYKRISVINSGPQPRSSDGNEASIPIDESSGKRPRIDIEISDVDIIGDPGLRKPIESYPYEIRDSLKRRYLAKGPCQLVGHTFPQTLFSGVKRRFQSKWFKKYPWLAYSVSKDKAYCLYCYVFGSSSRSGGTAYTKDGYGNWSHATENFIDHEGGINSPHNGCRLKFEHFLNQRGNIDYVLASRSTVLENDYRSRLTTVLHVSRFLLGEGLAFRGHDESEMSIHRGHFLGLIEWLCLHFEEVRKIMESAPKNNKLISSTIQRDIIESYAMEMRKSILNEIGDKFFSLLIDESRDSSVKEQMAVVLRFVDTHGEVQERFLGVVHVTDTYAQSLKSAIDSFFLQRMDYQFQGLGVKLAIVKAAQDKEVVSTFFEYISLIVNMVGALCKRKDALRELHNDEVVSKIQNRLIMNILAIMEPLSKTLQDKDQNIGNAICMIKVVKHNLQAYRQDEWKQLLKDVTEFCEKQEIDVPNMDDVIPGRSIRLLDRVAKTYSHHFHSEIFMKVIDLVIVEMDHRFKESETDLLRCIICLDPSNSFASVNHDRLMHLGGLYSEDFSSGELMELQHQLKNYRTAVSLNQQFFYLNGIGILAKRMVDTKYNNCFPLVYRLIELALVLPVATATVERCFSAMKIVKSDLRNRMGDELLSDSLLCYIEKKIFFAIEDEVILQRFQSLGSRKSYLPPICNSHV